MPFLVFKTQHLDHISASQGYCIPTGFSGACQQTWRYYKEHDAPLGLREPSGMYSHELNINAE
ncbi:hypothetical protein CYLTODRAFT_167872 [Cylindrobasidium torrendii FP15055 ss-10]|uniref:Uncharacterized protein n=1 Tax=Cylindrobasidium torrendii FP15055 ss-10 TaxID=1314674 RepID=A0A0D7BKV6_9AGAR|nr:hypothetical protein CYLTODRAFT_167872 [Cylindrobasidium torrendii FP15055 ss-10]